jgi:hypothetical protein
MRRSTVSTTPRAPTTVVLRQVSEAIFIPDGVSGHSSCNETVSSRKPPRKPPTHRPLPQVRAEIAPYRLQATTVLQREVSVSLPEG